MIREMKPCIAHIFCRGEYGILGQPRIRRDRQMTHVASDHDFNFTWRRASAEAIMQDRSGHSDNPAEEYYSDDDHESPAFRGHVNMLMEVDRSGQRRTI